MSWISDLLGYKTIVDTSTGPDVDKPQRSKLRIIGGEVADNPSLGTTDLTVASISPVTRFDNTHTALVRYDFNGGLTDSSGNSRNLSVFIGTERYGDAFPAVKGFSAIGTTLSRGTTDAALQITGDLTVQMLLVFHSYSSGNNVLIQCGLQGIGGESNNTLWQIATQSTGRNFRWRSQSGANNNADYIPTNVSAPALGQPFYLAATRASNVIQFYVNGRTYGAASSALTAPTGGTNGQLFICGDESNPNGNDHMVLGAKVSAGALSAAQIKAEHNRALGIFYGEVA